MNKLAKLFITLISAIALTLVSISSSFAKVENGYINLPETPGLGIDLDEESLAKYPYQEFPKRNIREYGEEGP